MSRPEDSSGREKYLEFILAYLWGRSTAASDLPYNLAWLATEPDAQVALQQLEDLLSWQDDPAWLEDIAAASTGVITPGVAELLKNYETLARVAPDLIEHFNTLRHSSPVDEANLLPRYPTFAEQFGASASTLQSSPIDQPALTGAHRRGIRALPHKIKLMPTPKRIRQVKHRGLAGLYPFLGTTAILLAVIFIICWLGILLLAIQILPTRTKVWFEPSTPFSTPRPIVILPPPTGVSAMTDTPSPRPSPSLSLVTPTYSIVTPTPSQTLTPNVSTSVAPSFTPANTPSPTIYPATPSWLSTLTPTAEPTKPLRLPTLTSVPPSPTLLPTSTAMLAGLAAETITGLTVSHGAPTRLGQATTLTATTTSGSNVTYDWMFGDDNQTLASGPVVTYTYPTAGVYTAVVTASNSINLVTSTTTVTITDENLADLTLASDSPTPLNQTTTLTAPLMTGQVFSYTWSFGDGASLQSSSPIISYTYPTPGIYTVVVTASNASRTIMATTTVTITAEIITGLNVINNSPTSVGQATTLTATITSGSDVAYIWMLGDDNLILDNGPVVTYTYPAAGVYTAVVTASNSANLITTTTLVTITDETSSE